MNNVKIFLKKKKTKSVNMVMNNIDSALKKDEIYNEIFKVTNFS